MENTPFSLDFEKPLRALQKRLDDLLETSTEHHFDVSKEVDSIRQRIEVTKREIYSNLTSWQEVQIARHPKRPYALDYIGELFEDFQELHGDRLFGDDQALIGGTAWFEGRAVVVIAQQKGRDTKENLKRNFGMPHPEGYRKALRLMEMAERFDLPVVSLIDTKAAFAGIGSEERHVSEAIARNLMVMSRLRVPIVGAILGEGGSGGALGIAVVDRLLVLEHSYYSVIPPEGCAAILWRSREFTEQAAGALQLGGRKLLEQGIADELVEEPLGGAHIDPTMTFQNLRTALLRNLEEISRLSTEELLEQRYQKYRRIGHWTEEAQAR
jgi:acetyl-CoA carboxylase carboxyl transferase subunit alpha